MSKDLLPEIPGSKFQLVNGVLHRQGQQLSCPFQSLIPLAGQQALTGAPAINIISQPCSLRCPLFDLVKVEDADLVRLRCSSSLYYIEVERQEIQAQEQQRAS